jgi:hypothetical protein
MKKEAIVFVIWFVIISVPLSILMAQHNLSFSIDVKSKIFAPSKNLNITQVLGAKCKCSRRIGRYLAEQTRPKNLIESIVVVDGELPNETDLLAKGFQISHVSVEGLKDSFNLESAPVLLIAGRDGKLKYSGGYKDIDQVDSRDLEIISQVQDGRKVASFPVLGCALSPALKTAMDPFQFKYKE